MSEAHRQIAYTEQPNGTHTQYLIHYPTGSVTEDVHNMIERVVVDAGLPEDRQLTGIQLIVNDKEAPVWVEVKDLSNGQGLEWEISQPHEENVAEYVRYNDDDRADVHTDEVYVEGFAEAPSYPVLAEADV